MWRGRRRDAGDIASATAQAPRVARPTGLTSGPRTRPTGTSTPIEVYQSVTNNDFVNVLCSQEQEQLNMLISTIKLTNLESMTALAINFPRKRNFAFTRDRCEARAFRPTACGNKPHGQVTKVASGAGDGIEVSFSRSEGSGERSSSRLRASRTEEASLAAASDDRSVTTGGWILTISPANDVG